MDSWDFCIEQSLISRQLPANNSIYLKIKQTLYFLTPLMQRDGQMKNILLKCSHFGHIYYCLGYSASGKYYIVVNGVFFVFVGNQ